MRTEGALVPAAAALAGFLLLVAAPGAAAAEETGTAISDREKAALSIEEDLMCHCGCTDLTVRVCNCGVAAGIKDDIRARLASGETPQAVEAAYVARYGEQIRSAPTRTGFNLLAWTMPFFVVFAAGAAIVVLVRRWKRSHAVDVADAARAPAPKPDRAALDRVDRAVRDLL